MGKKKISASQKHQNRKHKEKQSNELVRCRVCGFMPAFKFGATFLCKSHLKAIKETTHAPSIYND